MTQDEYNELNAAVTAVTVQDVHLGRALLAIVGHLPGYQEAAQAKAAKEQEAAAQPAEAVPVEEPQA